MNQAVVVPTPEVPILNTSALSPAGAEIMKKTLNFLLKGEGQPDELGQAIASIRPKDKIPLLTDTFSELFKHLRSYREHLIAFKSENRNTTPNPAKGTVFEEAEIKRTAREFREGPTKYLDGIVTRLSQIVPSQKRSEAPEIEGMASSFVQSLDRFIDSLPQGYVASGYLYEMLKIAANWSDEFSSRVISSYHSDFPLIGQEPEAARQHQLLLKAINKLHFPDGEPDRLKARITDEDTFRANGFLARLNSIARGGYGPSR